MRPDEAMTAWLFGANDSARLDELQRWLQADQQHRQQAREHLALHLALRAQLQPADQTVVDRLVSKVRATQRSARTTQRHRVARRCIDEVHRRQRRIRTSLALAAGLLIACVVTLAIWNGRSTPEPQIIARNATAIGRVSTLSGLVDLERTGLHRRLVEGEELHTGDRLTAGSGARVTWRDDHADLELRDGSCHLRPQADILAAVNAGLLRMTVTPNQSSAPQVRLIAATAAIETRDAVLQLAVSGAQVRLAVERGSAEFTHGDIMLTVTSALPVYSDATGAYRTLFHFDQRTGEPDARVAYGEPVADPACRDGWALRGVILDGSREVYLRDGPQGPLVMEAGAELRFSYRVEGSGPLRVFANNLNLQADVTADLGVVQGSGWHTATIRLADFHRQGEQFQQAGAAPGDRLKNLIIASDRPGTLTELRVDEVMWVAPAPRARRRPRRRTQLLAKPRRPMGRPKHW